MSLSRPVYLSRLRRAFLLRVHPDRFRNHASTVRSNQANLVKALADRMSESDFGTWQHAAGSPSPLHASPPPSLASSKDFPYMIELRDGTLFQTKIRLSDTVDTILASMAQALKKSGAASLPAPPKVQTAPEGFHPHHHKPSTNGSSSSFRPASSCLSGNSVYNISSNRGRDFAQFVSKLDTEEVELRKAHRMDAQAAALEARRYYQFQSIDATSLGWSSASVAQLLFQLVALHEEHSANFNVDKFYPVRLFVTPDDFHEALDVYGGVLRLSPNSTPIQWLESLRLVTEEKLNEMRQYREAVATMTLKIQGSLGVKLKKGFSCSNEEYYYFLKDLSEIAAEETAETSFASDSNSLILEPIRATVEAAQSCRRPVVSKDGSIRLGSGMEPEVVVQALSRLSANARKQLAQDKEERNRCKQVVQQVQWQLGLQRVYRTGVVSHDQFVECLGRILSLAELGAASDTVKRRLTGNSLGVAGSGHFCHLADDGSVVIPHDWR